MRLYNEDGHADYPPHNPGTLFDCGECEATCYCVPGETECVHCALANERKLNKRAIRYLDHFTY